MIRWIKRKWTEYESALLTEKNQLSKLHDEILKTLDNRETNLKERESLLNERSRYLDEKEYILSKTKNDLLYYGQSLTEKESFLNKIQSDMNAEKEAMLGKDNLEIKKQILLPVMRQRWEAEARQIDSERSNIMLNTPKIYYSLASKRVETENQISILKKKPSNMSNNDLLNRYQAQLDFINEFISVIDKERGKPDAENPHSNNNLSVV